MQTDQDKFYDSGRNYGDDTIDARLERILSFVRTTLTQTEEASISRVLDVGCANGIVLRSLPSALHRVGLDISSVLLARAQKVGIETCQCDFDNNPFPLETGSFDLILANDVIEHVLHTDHVLNEINRVLKPGGLLIISIPNVNQPISLIMQFILDLTPMFAARYRCTHYRDFSNRLFSRILSIHGFSISCREGSFIYPFENSRLSRFIARLIPRWGCQILYLARKTGSPSIPEEFAANMPELMKWFDSQGEASTSPQEKPS